MKRKLGLPDLPVVAPRATPAVAPAAPPAKTPLKTPLGSADINRQANQQQQQPSSGGNKMCQIARMCFEGAKTAEDEDDSDETNTSSATTTTTTGTGTGSSSTRGSGSSAPPSPGASKRKGETQQQKKSSVLDSSAMTFTASPGTDLTLSNSDCDDDDDDDDVSDQDTFSLYIPLDGVNHEPAATPVHQRQKWSNTASAAVGGGGGGGGGSTTRGKKKNPNMTSSSNNKKKAAPRESTVDAATDNPQQDLPVPPDQLSDDAVHMQAQLRRVQRERDSYSTDAAFFREAAEGLKSQLVFSKQQMMRQLEFCAEEMCRSELEQSEAELREICAAFFHGRRELVCDAAAAARCAAAAKTRRSTETLELSKKVQELEQQLAEKELHASANLSPRIDSVTAERDSVQRRLDESQSELAQARESIRAMTATWQERFNAMRAQHEKLLERFSGSACAESKLRSAVEQLLKMKRGARFVESRAMLAAVLESEQRARQLLEDSAVSEMILLVQICGSDSHRLTEQVEQAEKNVFCAEAESLKCRRRFDAVSVENEELVKHNAELQAELMDLRKKVFA